MEEIFVEKTVLIGIEGKIADRRLYEILEEMRSEAQVRNVVPGGAGDFDEHGGVINIGYNPTFGEETLVAETHIFDFNQNIYGKPIKVNLLKFLRGEEKFANIKELSEQISKDVIEAKEVLLQTGKQGDHLLW